MQTPNRSSFAGAVLPALIPLEITGLLLMTALAQGQEKKPVPTRPKVTVNRTVPVVQPPPQLPVFSSAPTDAEIFRARVFEEPLVPLGTTSPAENAALAQALTAYLKAGRSEDVGPVESFLRSNPRTAWRASVLTDLGVVYRRTGYFTKAHNAWSEAWTLAKDATEPRMRAIADKALGEFAELNARLGRYDVLENLLPEAASRGVRGSATEKLVGAKEGLWLMKNRPEKAFRCGPMALDRILAATTPGWNGDARLIESQSTVNGTSLVQMKGLGESVGLAMQMAYRTPGASVLTPAMAHWKAGHFAALVKQVDGRFLMDDPTFGDQMWVSRRAIDEEASGFFLVPPGPLPAGWRGVTEIDGGQVWGKGAAFGPAPPFITPDSPTTRKNNGPGCRGMATFTFHSVVVSLNVTDNPVGYSPSVGPSVQFQATYNQRDAFQPQIFTYSNLGAKWTFDWLAYIEDDPSNPTATATVYVRGGGIETHSGFDSGTQSYGPALLSRAVLVRTGTSPIQYERRLNDGSVEVFSQPDGASVFPRKVFMTQVRDPQGNGVTFTYDENLRVVAAVDALTQVTTISYELPSDSLKITKVTDPFGRFATFEYDPVMGQLIRITDVVGITSEFTYASAGDFISAITTPYGTTSFTKGDNGYNRWLEAIDPMGATERLEYLNQTETALQDPLWTYPTGFPPTPEWAQASFYFDKRTMALYPGDYSKARMITWLRNQNFNQAVGIKKSEKVPLENRVWYKYPGETGTGHYYIGTMSQPSTVARVLDDQSSQIYRYEYNPRGMKTKEIDPLGRETVFVYGTNNVPDPDPSTGAGLDLLQVKVKNNASPGGWDVTASYSYGDEHQPLTVTDAAGQTTTYTYTAGGLMQTVTTPPRAGITEDRTTTYTYEPGTDHLLTVTGPGGVTTAYAYDDYQRVRTTTDNDGYVLTYDYDSLDRQTRITYPDGTYKETVYEHLDPVRHRDRLGRWSHTFYDPLRRVSSTRDPEGRVVTQDWCTCGSLDKLVDPNGNATTWERDLQGRVTREVRANGSAKEFTYEATTSRLKKSKDAKLQEIHYTYALDDKLLQTTYLNAEHPTPNVTFSYTDPATSASDAHGRLRQMVDGTGTTSYAYQPITGAASLGAGQIGSADGPLANDTISYTYDELGRVVSRTLNGVTSSWSYDQEGRLQTLGDPIGNFTYTYLGNSGRVQTVTYPNSQTTTYAFYPVAQDVRLQQIHHKKPDMTTLNQFTYTYDVAGNILTWSQQTDSSPAEAYDFGYDRADQLALANFRTTDPTPTILKRYRYAYDPAGNRTAEQIDDAVKGATYDNMNRLVSQQAGGALLFGGTLNEPATVTVGGSTANVTAQNVFSGTASVPSGTSQVVVQATDPSGNVRTNTYEVSQSGSAIAFDYDANGNTTSDGVKTFEWDAENRLLAVKQGGNTLSSFTYDGTGRRATKTVAVATTIYVYDGAHFLEERPSAGSLKRYVYGSGIDRPLAQSASGEVSYFIADHLGSIVRTTDASSAPTLTREYDPWGNPLQGSTTSGYAFTGREWDSEAGVYYYRARYYDPRLARFASVDPIGFAGGNNSYAYVLNHPSGHTDSSGLQVDAVYNSANGKLCISDRDTEKSITIDAESGGKPYGDPIPGGSYEILEQARNNDFFRLDAMDSAPRNDVHEPTGRDNFRLHRPGRTIGCIAAKHWAEWREAKALILKTRTVRVPDNFKPWWRWQPQRATITKYGELVVR
jgi:RHS repeat-associated protein